MDATESYPPVEMVAFVVEGYGAFLVPLAVLDPYRVDTNPFDEEGDDAVETVGWGWQLPTVPWNAFDSGQANRLIALAPGLVTRLDPGLFPDAPWINDGSGS
jgi:hypothetical protein